MAQVLTNLKGGRLHAISMRRTADETRDAGLTLERADRVHVSTNSPLALGWVVKGVVQRSPADRLTIAKLLKPGDILVSVNGNSVLSTVAEKSSRHLFGPTEFSMELVVFSPDSQTREENSVLMEQLEKQHADARKDRSYMRSDAKKGGAHKAGSHPVRQTWFSLAVQGSHEEWEEMGGENPDPVRRRTDLHGYLRLGG